MRIDAIFHLGMGLFFFMVFLLTFLANMCLLSILNLTSSFCYFINFLLDFILKEERKNEK